MIGDKKVFNDIATAIRSLRVEASSDSIAATKHSTAIRSRCERDSSSCESNATASAHFVIFIKVLLIKIT